MSEVYKKLKTHYVSVILICELKKKILRDAWMRERKWLIAGHLKVKL